MIVLYCIYITPIVYKALFILLPSRTSLISHLSHTPQSDCQTPYLPKKMSESFIKTLQDLTFHPYSSAPVATTLQHDHLKIQAPKLVDWWRNPEPVKVNRKDGPFAHIAIDGSRPFQAEVWLRSGLKGLYDQACLVLHGGELADTSAHWLKTGTETFDERQWINAVVAAPWCDVSTVPSNRELSSEASGDWIYLKLVKELSITGHTILIKWSQQSIVDIDNPPTEDELANLREVQAFGVKENGERSDDFNWSIGVMVSGLMNGEGAFAEFKGFKFKYLD
ncbi:hypothetical protein J007_02124 [Cryptococcus neoformans]|nr:hypothetical protein J007_02124 [Cryptococcus neoformans var. grubii]OXC62385.1 hypothetical protein C358_02190 [Cryptococcus neoformans var. grubii MW-RSA852]